MCQATVVVIEGSDADRSPAIQRLKADGYCLADAFAFGDEVTGEVIGSVY